MISSLALVTEQETYYTKTLLSNIVKISPISPNYIKYLQETINYY